MRNSKIVKVLCEIFLGIIYLISLILCIIGIDNFINTRENISLVYIVIAIILSLVVTISIQPVLAISNIDINLTKIMNKLTETDYQIANKDSLKDIDVNNKLFLVLDYVNEKYNININKNDDINTIQSKISQIEEIIYNQKLEEQAKKEKEEQDMRNKNISSIDYINEKYNLNINKDDDIETIRLKISQIEESDSLIEIFKFRIEKAKDLNEVYSVIKMHKITTQDKY